MGGSICSKSGAPDMPQIVLKNPLFDGHCAAASRCCIAQPPRDARQCGAARPSTLTGEARTRSRWATRSWACGVETVRTQDVSPGNGAIDEYRSLVRPSDRAMPRASWSRDSMAAIGMGVTQKRAVWTIG